MMHILRIEHMSVFLMRPSSCEKTHVQCPVLFFTEHHEAFNSKQCSISGGNHMGNFWAVTKSDSPKIVAKHNYWANAIFSQRTVPYNEEHSCRGAKAKTYAIRHWVLWYQTLGHHIYASTTAQNAMTSFSRWQRVSMLPDWSRRRNSAFIII